MNNTKFNAVFITVVILTIVSGSTSLWLASQKTLSPEQQSLFNISTTTSQTGAITIFGLFGTKPKK